MTEKWNGRKNAYERIWWNIYPAPSPSSHPEPLRGWSIDRRSGGGSDILRNIFETPFSGSLRYILHTRVWPNLYRIFGKTIVPAWTRLFLRRFNFRLASSIPEDCLLIIVAPMLFAHLHAITLRYYHSITIQMFQVTKPARWNNISK